MWFIYREFLVASIKLPLALSDVEDRFTQINVARSQLNQVLHQVDLRGTTLLTLQELSFMKHTHTTSSILFMLSHW